MSKPNVLDDMKLITRIDKSDMLSCLLGFPKQCQEAVNIGGSFNLPVFYKKFNNVVLSGMGGSAIGADLVRSYVWDSFGKPIYVNRNYTLPGFVNSSTVLFCLSYSGNTEETISSYREGKKRDAKIIIMTSGGKLKQIARNENLPCIDIPAGLAPRQALGYSFFPLLYAVLKLTGQKPVRKSVDETIVMLEDTRELFSPQIRAEKNLAKKIAIKLYRKIPLIYGGQDHIDSIVTRFRNQIEENSKHIAFSHIFPEMNHNEIVGWENPKTLLDDIVAVFLRDVDDHERTKLRMDITQGLIKDYAADITEIKSCGNSLLSRMFYLIYLVDFISFYLALLNNADPTPVEKVKYLKDKLARL